MWSHCHLRVNLLVSISFLPLRAGNKSIGGLLKVTDACGLVGFVKFLDCYYFTLITQKKKVGCIGANFVYSIKATEVFAVKPREEHDNNTFRQIWKKLNKKLNQTASEIAESRYMGLFQFVDLTKDFYFTYSYDLTHSLQHNFIMSDAKKKSFPPPPAQEMFEWNHFQTEEMRSFKGDCCPSTVHYHSFWLNSYLDANLTCCSSHVFGLPRSPPPFITLYPS